MSETAAALGIKSSKLARVLKATKLRLPLDHVEVGVVLYYAQHGVMPPEVDDEGTEGYPVEYLRDPARQPLLVAERHRRERRLVHMMREAGLKAPSASP